MTESTTPDFPILTVIGSSESEDSLITLLGIFDILLHYERRAYGFDSAAYPTCVLDYLGANPNGGVSPWDHGYVTGPTNCNTIVISDSSTMFLTYSEN